MKLYISALADAKQIQEEKGITKTLGILEYDPLPFYSSTSNSVNTVIKVSDHEWFIDYTSPNNFTVEEIIKFAETLNDDDNVLIHCHAGISRSTAAAMIVVFHLTRSIYAVKNAIEEARPNCAPNRLIARIADNYYEHFDDNKLYNLAEEICTKNNIIGLSNHKSRSQLNKT